jgi:hypothetical protein
MAENNTNQNLDLISEMQTAANASSDYCELPSQSTSIILRKNIDDSNSETYKAVSVKSAFKLVVTPNKSYPLAPFGIGEMIRAAKIETSALDQYLENMQNYLSGIENNSSAFKRLASIRYETQEKRSKPNQIKNNSRQTSALNTIQNAIEDALTATQEIIDSNKIIKNKNEKGLQYINELDRRKKQILPFAEKYIKKLGYETVEGEAETILKETVEFYSKSPALAETLKNLVGTLENNIELKNE